MYSRVWSDRHRRGQAPTNHAEITLVTPPAIEPVSLTQVKAQSRITYNDSDALLTFYIAAARDRVERYLRRSLITQTWDLTLDWGPGWVELPKPPLQTVVGVYTTSLDNVETPVAVGTYLTNIPTNFVSLSIGQVWPLHRGKAGFRVRFTTGYGDTPDSVPMAIRKEILSLAAQFDDIREQIDLPPASKATLLPYRVMGEPFRMARGMSQEDLLA